MFEKMFLILPIRRRINEIEIMQHMLEEFHPSTHIHPRPDLMCFMHNLRFCYMFNLYTSYIAVRGQSYFYRLIYPFYATGSTPVIFERFDFPYLHRAAKMNE